MRTDIRSKMILMIGLPTATILIGAFILSLWYFRNQSYNDARRNISSQAATYASRFDDALDQAVLLTSSTAAMIESMDDLSFEGLQHLLERNVNANPWLYGAAVAFHPDVRTRDGDLFAPYAFRNNDKVTTMNIGRGAYDWAGDDSYEWFHGPATSGNARWTAPYFDKGAGNVLMTTYSVPIMRNEKFVGVVTADIDLSHLDVRTRELLGLPQKFLIAASDGSYIYTPDQSRILGGSFLEDVEKSKNTRLIESTRKALAGETGTSSARWHIDGAEKIMAYAPIPSTGWSYITYIPESMGYEHVQDRMIIPTLLFISALGLVILSILAASKKLAKPIIDLRGKVQQIAEGNLDAKADHTNAKDEIGDLARSFNQMTDDLRNQVTKIALEESRRQEAVDANQAKSQFLSHMSHELRTPLNGVLGYAQIMQRDESIGNNQRRNLDGIINCGDHLLALINDVLDLSKIEAGHEEVNSEAVNLERLVRGVSDIVSEKAKAKGLKFIVDVSPEVPRIIIGDKGKIRQVLVNLIGNAVKFTTSGSVTLSLKETTHGHLQFDIIDTGQGISQEHLETIFDPFIQTDGGKAAGGTGLGLAISQKIASLLEGELTVTSEVDKGSCFRFTLPFEEFTDDASVIINDDDDSSGEDIRLAPGQKVSLLVADDGSANRDIMQQMLHAAGFKVLMTTDGDEALELLAQTDPPPPLALLDVRMARMSGIEAMQQIRKDPRCKHMKIVAVTASVFPDFRRKALAAGFDDFIGKPFRIRELMSCLKEHLDIEFIGNSTHTRSTPSDDSPAETSATTTLPAETIERLQNALKIRSLTQINAIAKELKSDPETTAIGNEITDLVAKFDFNKLGTRVESLTATPS